MIYLKNIEDLQQLLIPKGREFVVSDIVFEIFSPIYQDALYFDIQGVQISSLYYVFSLSLPRGIEQGEYEYLLKDSLGELSSGVLKIGCNDNRIEYKIEHEYKEFATNKSQVFYDVLWEYEEYEFRPDLYIDISDSIIWLLPDDFTTNVDIKSNVDWRIE